MRYLIIPRIEVRNFNALQTWWLSAPPSPMALQGFITALKLKTGFVFSRFAIVHHDWQLQASRNPRFRGITYHNHELDEKVSKTVVQEVYLPSQFKGATVINKNDLANHSITSNSLQPTARGNCELSLVIEIPDDNISLNLEAINDFLWSGRLRGGEIWRSGPIAIVSDWTEIKNIIRTGFWVKDRKDLTLEYMHRYDIDGTEAILRAVLDHAPQVSSSPAEDSVVSEEEEEHKASPHPWLSANCVGYKLLEEPQIRKGSLQSLPHAYCEPLVGLIQYCSVRKQQAAQEAIPFWRYNSHEFNGSYLVTGD